MMAEDSGYKLISGNFITSRSDCEIVNGLAGIMTGMLLPFPLFSLKTSAAFSGLLQVSSSEWIWSVFFFAWGVGTFAAWACESMCCRRWMMLLSTCVWSFLFWSCLFVALVPTLSAALMASLGAGSMVAFKRMQRAEE